MLGSIGDDVKSQLASCANLVLQNIKMIVKS
jgi:hypothetical protein